MLFVIRLPLDSSFCLSLVYHSEPKANVKDGKELVKRTEDDTVKTEGETPVSVPCHIEEVPFQI